MATTCLIFDIDGTLVDTGISNDTLYARAVHEVLGAVRIRAEWGDYEHVTDAGIFREICRENGLELGLIEQQARERLGALISAYLSSGGLCRPIPGALAFWNRLRERASVEMGIATGGWGHTARMKLVSAGFAHSGVPLASSDDAHARVEIMRRCREQLSPAASTVYFGDGEWDRAAAESLGWGFVGVGGRLQGKCPNWIADFSSIEPLEDRLVDVS